MSDLGNLSHCIVYGDAREIGQARRLRGGSLAASMALEGLAIACLLLWPLLKTAVLPPQHMAAPVPVFRPEPRPRPPIVQEIQHQVPRQPGILNAPTLRQPIRIPANVEADDSQPIALLEVPGPSAPDGIGAEASGPQSTEIVRPEAKPRSSGPVKMSSGVLAARLLHSVQPDYPSLAKLMHLTGTVQLRAIIGTDGTVQNLQVVSGHPILAKAALDAVRQWRYQPTLLSGHPVEVETVITLNFQMP